MSTATTDFLARMLEPVTECLTPEAATKLVNLRPDPALQKRMAALAEKANEGQLTAKERTAYEDYIDANDLIGILQAQARAVLRRAAS
ncbi:MAG: hypothetical protein HYS13_10810 [Planctomycetia bacterium]|nr:hypothetical protein [Planctomycetia bacterium]